MGESVVPVRVTAGLIVLFLLTTSWGFATAEPDAGTGVPVGLNMGSVQAARDAGLPTEFGSYWIGAWTAHSGWGGPENAMKKAATLDVTPVFYWYYWGDSITPSCVENGCDGRSKAEWYQMTRDLAAKFDQHLGGHQVYVVLENEFNKGGITRTDYAPTFDAYLAEIAGILKGTAGVKTVIGYGSWGEEAWDRFPQAVAASDAIGFQIMRGSTRDNEPTYRNAPDKISSVLDFSNAKFGKPAFLYDLALSSYPSAKWETMQAEVMDEIAARAPEYAEKGLLGIVYRELRDNPGMDPKNYFGYAEQHWGLTTSTGAHKPVFDSWKRLASGAPTEPPVIEPATPNIPGSFEGESMSTSIGARSADPAASGGATWNLWSDGELRQTVSGPAGDYTIEVTARGTSLGGVNARMELRLDGVVLSAHTVPQSLTTFRADATMSEGPHTLSVAFTNDARSSTEDRNLLVDVVRVAEKAPEPEPPAPNRAPDATFDIAMDGLTGTFDASSSQDTDGDALSFAWDFGDGSTATGTIVSHAYPSAGEYVVTLAASDGNATSNATRSVTAIQPNRAPSAAFTATGDGLTFAFDASGSADADGDALAFTWDFGDGATATGARVSHTYADDGDYLATLTASDDTASDSATRTIHAERPNTAPVAAFSAEGEDLIWTFDASGSSDADGDALTYTWTFGDGTGATGITASHTYETPGDHVVALAVTDGEAAATATATVTATRPNAAPVAAFEATGSHLSWSFDAGASADADHDELTYAWDLGDGVTASGPTVGHEYAAAGDYIVSLTVDDGRGGTSTATSTLTVTDPPAPEPEPAPEAERISLEAEDFEDHDNGMRIKDAKASAGAGWLLWSVGAARTTVPLGAGTHHVELVARGDFAAGWPIVELRDGHTVLARWVVDSAEWATFDADIRLDSATTGALALHFVNDYYRSGADRNVHLDRLIITSAAHEPAPQPATLHMEVEEFKAHDNGVRFNDAAASGNAGWILWSNGGAETPIELDPGTYVVTVRAKGDYAAGWPEMDLRLDGRSTARWTVADATWESYSATIEITRVGTVLSLEFLNDHFKDGQDRNLRIDDLQLTQQPAP